MARKQRDRDFARMVGGMLRSHGYELTNIDSNDKAMTAALLDFQAKRGLRKTGTATPQTFEALKQPPVEVQPLVQTTEAAPTDEGTFTQTGGLTLASEPVAEQPEESADAFLRGWEEREGFEPPNVQHRPPVAAQEPVVELTPEEAAKQEIRDQQGLPPIPRPNPLDFSGAGGGVQQQVLDGDIKRQLTQDLLGLDPRNPPVEAGNSSIGDPEAEREQLNRRAAATARTLKFWSDAPWKKQNILGLTEADIQRSWYKEFNQRRSSDIEQRGPLPSYDPRVP